MSKIEPTVEKKEIGACRFHQPGHLFTPKDKFGVSFYPAIDTVFEVMVRRRQGGAVIKYVEEASYSILKFEKTIGDYVVQFRWKRSDEGNDYYSPWSNAKKFKILDETDENSIKISAHRLFEHQIDTVVSRLSNDVVTLHNPFLMPPNHPGLEAKWFMTGSYEGSTPLLNQNCSYYMDPLKYFLNCVAALKEKNANFVTWRDVISHELLEEIKPTSFFQTLFKSKSQPKTKRFDCLLQFDIDAGIKSIFRIADELDKMDVIGSLMIHRKADEWYSWELSETDIGRLQALEAKGWEIGYHNNSLSAECGLTSVGNYSKELLQKATQRFSEDVQYLRQYFTIDVFTHHGGNVFNRYVSWDADLNITCVDRKFSAELWEGIKGKYSDGGFLCRPLPLDEHIRTLNCDLNFFRIHPVKFANYEDAPDVPALPAYKEVLSIEEVNRKVDQDEELSELEKQFLWTSLRSAGRRGTELDHASLSKPLSSQFENRNDTLQKIDAFRSLRRESFLKMYPWAYGDPRVFWWHLLATFSIDGKVLNVGAMPANQKAETIAFLPDTVKLLEIDIDEEREPDILGDFSNSQKDIEGTLDMVLLFGLPYFERPKEAIENCYKTLKSSGRAIIGFCGDTHPERGGLWRPIDRPVWRPDKKITPPLNLKTKLWSFDDKSVDFLFENWPGTLKVEYHAHYWFVVGEVRNG